MRNRRNENLKKNRIHENESYRIIQTIRKLLNVR